MKKELKKPWLLDSPPSSDLYLHGGRLEILVTAMERNFQFGHYNYRVEKTVI